MSDASCPYNFERAYHEWGRVPVDDFDYMTGEEIILLHPLQRKELFEIVNSIRYSPYQWRNRNNALTNFMGLDSLQNKTVIDFGCGMGLDAIQFVKSGANVILADMHPTLLLAAQQMMATVTHHRPVRMVITYANYPWFCSPKCDLFWSFGVLHHNPYIKGILQEACNNLNEGGVCKVILYSDVRWAAMTDEKLPDYDIWKHPKFHDFVRKCDTVGEYADAYSQVKIHACVKDFAEITDFCYLCDDQFIGVTLKPKVK